MLLKTLTVFHNDNVARFQNFKMEGENYVSTPIEYDHDKKTAVVAMGPRDNMYIDLNQVMMYRIEAEAELVQ
jgi:hypothetical protein